MRILYFVFFTIFSFSLVASELNLDLQDPLNLDQKQPDLALEKIEEVVAEVEENLGEAKNHDVKLNGLPEKIGNVQANPETSAQIVEEVKEVVSEPVLEEVVDDAKEQKELVAAEEKPNEAAPQEKVVDNSEQDMQLEIKENINDLLDLNQAEGENASEEVDNVALEMEKALEESKKIEQEAYEAYMQDLETKSLFFNSEQVQKLKIVKEAVLLGNEVSDQDIATVSETEESGDVEVPLTRSSISFYLNSIIYRSNDDWAVWINGNKIRENSEENEIYIVEINKKYIKCRWKTGYAKFVKKLSMAELNEELPKSTSLEIVDNIAKVEFILRPNQSFEVGNKVVINEGKRK